MKTKKMFELRDDSEYCDTFKTEKAAIKWIENHLKRNYKMWGLHITCFLQERLHQQLQNLSYLQVVA